MQTRARAAQAAMSSDIGQSQPGNGNGGSVDLQFLVKLQEKAQKTAIKQNFRGTKNLQTFMTQLKFAFTIYEIDAKKYYPDYEMPGPLKCEFAYSNLDSGPHGWFTLMQNKDHSMLSDWDKLEAALYAKYNDPNREYNAYTEWRNLEMRGSLDAYENQFDLLIEEMVENMVPPPQAQVLHYISGLRDSLRTKVLSIFVKEGIGYELEQARNQARVLYNEEQQAPKPARKPQVTSKVAATGFPNNTPYQQEKHSRAPTYNFGPDKLLEEGNFVRSPQYPNYVPRTLKGPLDREPNSEGHKLREFCTVNNLCNYCRYPGHKADECLQNPNVKNRRPVN